MTKELCGECAALLREGFDVKRVGGGVDNKITCSNCGRRRYGATYEVSVRKRPPEKSK
jgi:hypothetical protein